jgi:hypothetical protein
MPRDNRPLLVSLLGTGFLLALVAANDPLARPRLTELLPAAVVSPTCPAGQAVADSGSPIIAPEVVEVHDLATVKPADAARLDGKRALYRVVIDGPRDCQGDRDVYEVLPCGDPQGTAFLPAGLDVDGV